MRIKITAGGIFGKPTDENPTGELPIGHELTVDKAPEGWAGRYIDLDEHRPSDDVNEADALKARVAELEGEVASKDAEIDRLKAQIPASSTAPLKAEHHGGGKFNITQGETVLASNLTKADADAFNAMNDAEKAEYVAKTKA